MSDPGKPIDWERLSRERFERIVEALLVRDHQGRTLPEEARAVDGRGGDGGKDIDVVRDGTTVGVYQLKHFPEGMSGGWGSSRRAQVKKSMKQAAKIASMADWTLVMPRNFTDQERKAVTVMRGAGNFRIHFMGRAELDLLIVRYPDLQGWLLRDDLVDLVRGTSLEAAALVGPQDLPDQVRRLHNLADTRSENWGVAFGVRPDGTVTQSLYAKRDDAAEREPISIRMQTRFGPDHAKLRDAFQQGMELGTFDPIVLPGEVVESLVFEGPEWLAAGGAPIEQVTISTLGGEPNISLELRAKSQTGATVAVVRGTAIRAAGTDGGRLRAAMDGGLAVDLLFTMDKVTLTFDLDIRDQPASDLQRVVRLFGAVGESDLQLVVGDYPPVSLRGYAVDDGFMVIDDYIRELVEDLARIEIEYGLPLAMPPELSNRDRIDIRILRLLVDGHCVRAPWPWTMELTVQADLAKEILTDLPRPKMVLSNEIKELPFEISGQTLPVGPLRSYWRNVRIDITGPPGPDGAQALTASADNEAELVVWLSDRVRDPDAPLIPAPWRLSGIDELPDVSPELKGATTRSLESDSEEPPPERAGP